MLSLLLELVTKIRPGETIDIANMKIIPYNFYNRLYRWWNGKESRNRIMNRIEEDIGANFAKLTFEERLKLIRGLYSLLDTYGRDKDFVERVNITIAKLRPEYYVKRIILAP